MKQFDLENMLKLSAITTSLFMFIIGVFTCFMFLNIGEILFEIDIPYINAISTVQAQQLLKSTEITTDIKQMPLFGTMQSLRISHQNIRLEIIPGIIKENVWFARTNKVHALGYAMEDRNNLLLYVEQSWRTIPHPETIAKGDNVYIDTTEWRYLFRINEVYTIKTTDLFVPTTSENTQLLIVIDDGANQIIHIYQADQLDMQSIPS